MFSRMETLAIEKPYPQKFIEPLWTINPGPGERRKIDKNKRKVKHRIARASRKINRRKGK